MPKLTIPTSHEPPKTAFEIEPNVTQQIKTASNLDEASATFQALADESSGDQYAEAQQKVKTLMAKKDALREKLFECTNKEAYWDLKNGALDEVEQQLYWYQGQMRDLMTRQMMAEMAAHRDQMKIMTDVFQDLIHQVIKKGI